MKYARSYDAMQGILTNVAVHFVLALSFYFLFAGHNFPGGGFIGGLTTSCALALIYLIFDRDSLNPVFSSAFPSLIAIGLLLAFIMGLVGVVVGDAFLTQYFTYFQLPLLGELELTTALLFDLGVYFVVVGVAMVIMLNIAEDN